LGFADGNGVTGIDLDHHRDPAPGELDYFAKPISKRRRQETATGEDCTQKQSRS